MKTKRKLVRPQHVRPQQQPPQHRPDHPTPRVHRSRLTPPSHHVLDRVKRRELAMMLVLRTRHRRTATIQPEVAVVAALSETKVQSMVAFETQRHRPRWQNRKIGMEATGLLEINVLVLSQLTP